MGDKDNRFMGVRWEKSRNENPVVVSFDEENIAALNFGGAFS